MNRSKVEFQREKCIGFKQEIELEIVGDGAVCGGDLQRRGGGFAWRRRCFRNGLDYATILLQFLP